MLFLRGVTARSHAAQFRAPLDGDAGRATDLAAAAMARNISAARLAAGATDARAEQVRHGRRVARGRGRSRTGAARLFAGVAGDPELPDAAFPGRAHDAGTAV